MEFIDGEHLLQKLCKLEGSCLTEKVAAEYMFKLFSAINYCHANGVIHRDIKPENIMVTKDN
jgi:serine/threonine protein kinase